MQNTDVTVTDDIYITHDSTDGVIYGDLIIKVREVSCVSVGIVIVVIFLAAS